MDPAPDAPDRTAVAGALRRAEWGARHGLGRARPVAVVAGGVRAGRDVGPGVGTHHGRAVRRRGAPPGRARGAGTDGQRAPKSLWRTAFRELVGGSAADRRDRGRDRRGYSVARGGRDPEALRSQRQRNRAAQLRRRDRRSDVARGLPQTVRAGHREGFAVGADGRLQLGERPHDDREFRAGQRHPQG